MTNTESTMGNMILGIIRNSLVKAHRTRQEADAAMYRVLRNLEDACVDIDDGAADALDIRTMINNYVCCGSTSLASVMGAIAHQMRTNDEP